MVAKDLADCLTRLGYVVGTAATRDAALERAGAARPDVVLMGIRLRGEGDGIQAAEEIRARFDLPVVYLTAYADEATLERVRPTGPFGYLLKPFREQEVHATIQMALHIHRAERELRQAKARLEHVVAHIHDALLIDDVAGRVVYANDRFLDMFGLSREDLPQLTLEDCVAPEWRAVVSDRHDQPLRGETVPRKLELEGVRRDGTRLWLEIIVVNVMEAGQLIGTQSTIRDVTTRKQAEQALEESQSRLAALIENAGEPMWSVDAESRLLSFNSAFTQLVLAMSGCAPAAGLSLRDLVPSGVLAGVLSAIDRTLAGEGVAVDLSYAHGGRTHDARLHASPILADGRVTGAVAFLNDITALREAEAVTRRNAARVAALDELSRATFQADLDYQAVLDIVARRSVEIIGDACVISLLSDDGDELKLAAVYHADAAVARLMHETLSANPYPVNASLAGRVVQTGEAVLLTEQVPDQFRALLRPEFHLFLDRVDLRSILIVPLWGQGRVIATLALFRSTRGRAYSHEDRVFVQDMADRAAQAVTNARLIEETRRHASNAEARAEISRALSEAGHEVAAVLDLTVRRVADLMGDACIVSLLSDDGRWLQLAALHHPHPDVSAALRAIFGSTPHPAVGAPFDRVVQAGQRLVLAEVPEPMIRALARPEHQHILDRFRLRSLLAVPMREQGRVLGMLAIASERPMQRLAQADQAFLQDLADRAAIAMVNAQLYQKLEQRLQISQALREVDRVISASLDLNTTLHVLAEQARAKLRVDWVNVRLLAPERATLELAGSSGVARRDVWHAPLTLGQGPVGRAALERRIVHIPNIRQSDDWVAREIYEPAEFAACYAVPMVVRGNLKGVLEILNYAPLTLDSSWVDFTESLAALAAIAIDHAQLVHGLEQSVRATNAAQGQLLRAARLSAVGELAAGVAHQLNNPLTTIVTDAYVLLNTLEPEHAGRESAQAIDQAAWRAQRVVRRLLNLARPNEGDFILTDLNETVTEALDLVAAHIRRGGVEVNMTLAPDLPSIVAIGEQLEEVWINLVLNARDAAAASQPGRIRITSRLAAGGQAVEVEVIDNGRGMTAAEQAQVFTPFFFFFFGERGYGFGLSVCQSIVRAHGGEITFESAPGQGTAFRVRLPLDSPRGLARTEGAHDSPPA